MIDTAKIVERALEAGFTCAAPFDPAELNFRQDVRDMCTSDKCHNFNRNWSCPPACGSIEQWQERVKGYTKGVLVQTVGQLEDSFDIETMQETSEKHKENFQMLAAEMIETYGDVIPLGAGGCTLCKKCAYPEPCRQPKRAIVSMEASGLWVTEVCNLAGIPYNHGKDTLAYSSAFLFR